MNAIQIIDEFAQSLRVSLAGQDCRIELRQTTSAGLFCSLYVNEDLVIGGVQCRDRTRIVRQAYLGFVGDLVFLDTRGQDDPSSPGLGSRFVLYYLEAGDDAGAWW